MLQKGAKRDFLLLSYMLDQKNFQGGADKKLTTPHFLDKVVPFLLE